VLTTLLGELTAVPWQRPHAVPSHTVLSTWRAAIGEAPLLQLQRELLAAVGTSTVTRPSIETRRCPGWRWAAGCGSGRSTAR
jgi:hypothetical protein